MEMSTSSAVRYALADRSNDSSRTHEVYQVLGFKSPTDGVAEQIAESVVSGISQRGSKLPRVVLVVGGKTHTENGMKKAKHIINQGQRLNGTVLNIPNSGSKSSTALNRQPGMIKFLSSTISQWKKEKQEYPQLVNFFIDLWGPTLRYHNYIINYFYSSLPNRTDDLGFFKELGNLFNPNELVNKQLAGFDFAIVIAIEIDDFVLFPGLQNITSKKVEQLHKSLLDRVGSRMLSNVWKVVLLPIDLRGYKPPMKSQPSRYKRRGRYTRGVTY
jgi:hypothetical protein